MNRETHNVEIRSFDLLYSDISDPFLNAVCSCLVKWFEIIYVIINLAVCKVFEVYFRSVTERAVSFRVS